MSFNINYFQTKISKSWYAEIKLGNKLIHKTSPRHRKEKVEQIVAKHLPRLKKKYGVFNQKTQSIRRESNWDNTCYSVNPITGEKTPL